MLSTDYLQPQRRALQEQYDLSSQKLLELRRSFAIESDVAVRFKLEKQIEQVEADLNQVAQQLDTLDRAAGSGRLYQALLKLGYRAQVRAFQRFIQAQSVAAFLIHGSPDCGQRWLLNRLVLKHVSSSLTGKVVRIELSRVARKNNVAALWRELSGRVGLGRQSSLPDIAERVYQWWQTQNVLLIFYDVDFLPETSLNELIQEFWFPLAAKTREAAHPNSFKLLMFLIDYDGCVGCWNLPFAEQIDPAWQPDTPVKLPIITAFSDDELTTWIEYEAEDLPSSLTDNVDQTVQTILENSDNGIPEPALGEICQICGCDWYAEEETWLKL